MAAPELLTQRLKINDLHLGDAPTLRDYRSHEDVARFQGWIPASVDDAQAFITRNLSGTYNSHESWYQLAIRLQTTDELIGDLGVHFVSDDGHQAEIGFTIAPAHQRQGLGSEAVSGLLEHLFTELGKHRVFASVDPRNEASMKLMNKVGMRQEAHFRQSMLWKGEWVDDVVFAQLGAERDC